MLRGTHIQIRRANQLRASVHCVKAELRVKIVCALMLCDIFLKYYMSSFIYKFFHDIHILTGCHKMTTGGNNIVVSF